jgi:uncharacterized OsmC-like protein
MASAASASLLRNCACISPGAGSLVSASIRKFLITPYFRRIATGYAACFENALLRVGREAGRRFADQDIQVIAEIGLSKNPADAFVLAAALFVTIAGVDQQTAETLVESAHHICPYSNAIRGNVAVKTTVSVS